MKVYFTYLYTVKKVQPIWIHIEEMMNKYDDTPIDFGEKAVLWNELIDKPAHHIKNCICLIVKYYIYAQRCQSKKLCFRELLEIINRYEQYEKYYAVKNNVLHKHLKKWYPNKYKSREFKNGETQHSMDQYATNYINDIVL